MELSTEVLGLLNSITSLLLLFVTGIYAVFTYRILKENRKAASASRDAVDAMKNQTESAYRPYITVSHRLNSRGLIMMTIQNTGQTSAHNLRLSIDQDFYQAGMQDHNIKDSYAFCNIIESFSPGSKLVFTLDHSLILHTDEPKDKQPLQFKIDASYGFGNKHVQESTVVDLRPYRSTFLDPEPSERQLENIHKSLEEIAKALKSRDR